MTTDLQALIQHLRGGDWNLRAPQEMADMIADKLEAALAVVEAAIAAPHPSPSAAEQAGRWVPVEPTEEMWGGLARDIVWWLYGCSAPHYGSKLHRFLESLGCDIPEWLTKEIPKVDHTPPKGTVAACIYKAMLAVAPSASPAEAPAAPWTPEAIAVLGAAQPVAPAGQAAAGAQGEAFVNPEDWLLTGEAATRIANGYRVTTGVVQAIAKAVHELRPAPAVERGVAEVDRLRAEQAAAVMPLIGPLLDAWDGLPNDEKAAIREGSSDLAQAIADIGRGMDGLTPRHDDTDRLDWLEQQAKASRTGVSLTFARHVEDGYVQECGYRVMRHHNIGDFKRDIRAAIDEARANGIQPAAPMERRNER